MLLNWLQKRADARTEAALLIERHGLDARLRCLRLIEEREHDPRKVRFLRMVLRRLPRV